MATKKEIFKTNWVLLVILFLTVLGLTTGIYWWQKKYEINTSSDTELTKPSPNESPTPTPTTENDETADWKIYTSQKYKFSIKYHPSWVYKEYENNKLSVAFAASEDTLPKPETEQPACISISVQPKMGDNQRTNDISKMKKETITVGDEISATKIILLPGRDGDLFGEDQIVDIEIPISNDEVISITNFDDCQVEIFNKMINTFEFLK